MIMQGGPVFWLIVALGIGAMTVFFERLLHLRRAQIDYSETGGAKGDFPTIKAWLPKALGDRFPRYQHMVATTKLELNGDEARSRTILFNPMVYAKPDGTEQVFFIGLWYRDRLVRTPDGWRIAERYEEMSYAHNTPDMSPIPDVEKGA